ncbi:alpha/beta fold hydrolase [Candidatus Desantisbacteria bacterium]|nr:alpha/beta fold hydrolase [Candidatus Desantisbacteria bacterium]
MRDNTKPWTFEITDELAILMYLVLILIFFYLPMLHADLINDIDLAQKKYQTEYLKIKHRLRPGNEPFLLSHGQKTKVAFLLIHGFTASPWEMKDMGEYLYKKGYNVYGICLPGHATSPDDLMGVTWQDWYKSVCASYEITKLLGNKVVIAGESTGGVLALYLAANKPNVSGVISLSSAVFFQNRTICLSGIAKYFIKYNIRPLEEKYKPYYYEKRAMPAVYEVYKLSREIIKELSKINQPVLIIHSKKDKTVRYKSSEFIFNEINSKNKKFISLENAPHVLTTVENPEQREVFEIIYSWVKDF